MYRLQTTTSESERTSFTLSPSNSHQTIVSWIPVLDMVAAVNSTPPHDSVRKTTTTSLLTSPAKKQEITPHSNSALRSESNGPPASSCPPMTGKIRNQYSQRKTVQEALADCGDDHALRSSVKRAVDCDEYKKGVAVPPHLLTPLCETGGTRSQSKCRFPGCGKLSVRTDRAKEHARVHIGNHPYACQRVQSDGSIGCGATFLRKHDRNRHDNGADILKCEACGANIQGKGREYNLQRHRVQYCPVTKAAKAHTSPSTSPTPQSDSKPMVVDP